MARLKKTVQIIQVDLLALDDQDLRILTMALAMYLDYDNAQQAIVSRNVEVLYEGDGEECFPLDPNARLALEALHRHVGNAQIGVDEVVS